MQKFRNLSAILSVLLVAIWFVTAAQAGQAPQPVVLELFTSEGCSSCPPADALLSQLSHQRTAAGVELMLLGEHVEYWNGLGWRDRFSAPAFTQRQYDYVRKLHLATAYTPQIVVDGHLQAVGGNAGAVQRMIAEAARTAKPAAVSLKLVSPDKLQVTVADSGVTKLEVLLAVTEDNLSTSVLGGENGGRILQHNAVVRELHMLGATSNGRFNRTVTVPDRNGWKAEDLRVVVLVQDASSGGIHGAASIPFQSPGRVATGR